MIIRMLGKGSEGGNMTGWPYQIQFALTELGDQYPGDELSVEAFASRWGGLDHVQFVRAVQRGDGEHDQLLAILVLACNDTPETRALLVPLLQSPYHTTRWISAYCLGKMRDERALPVLRAIVTESPPLDEPSIEYEDQPTYREWIYRSWRPEIVQLLREWEGS